MKKARMIDYLTSLWIILFMTFFIIIFNGCRKSDMPNNDQVLKQIEEKFLTLPANSSPELQRIANKLREQNDKFHFIPEFVKKNGYPVWEKVLWNNSSRQNHSASQRLSNINDTLLFFIPLQQSPGAVINSYITCLSPDSNDYRFSYYNKIAIEALQSVDSSRKHFLENALSIHGYFNKRINNKDTLYVAGVFNEVIFNVSVNFGNNQTGGKSSSAGTWIGIEICYEYQKVFPVFYKSSGETYLDCYTTWYFFWNTEPVQVIEIPWWENGGGGGGGGGGGSSYSDYNRTDTDYETGDYNDNTEGNYDSTSYSDYDPQTQTWPTIQNVISTNDFVGWNRILHPTWQCMQYAKAQIAKKGYQISDYYKPNSTILSDQTIQVYTAANGVDKNAAKNGVGYLISALQRGIPVIVGVDDQTGSPNPGTDNTTDHFIVIVGTGTDANGNYFTFYDNASGDLTQGASPDNKLYYYPTTGMITGKSQTSYAQAPSRYDYIVTQIRKSK